MKQDLILRLAVPSPLRRLFDYLPPHEISDTQLQPGTRFSVPFGSRQQIALLVETAETSDFPIAKLKRVNKALDNGPTLPTSLVRLGNWIANYYLHPIGDVFSHILPVALRTGELAADKVYTGWQLTQKGRLVSADTLGVRAKKQRLALTTLQAHEHALTTQTLSSLEISAALLKNLQNLGLVEPVEWEASHEPWQGQTVLAEAPLKLNLQQATALHLISEKFGNFAAFLLFGVTGSGKTEVYLQAMERAISNNYQALVLVPEIGLTPQTVARFKQRFRVPIVVIHSGLTDLQRLDAWQAARSGNAAIIIGTRSAVFTPLATPGLIIIDEEHDSSYKQLDGLRYSARDVAVMRAQQENIPIILGSATPSFESLHNAQQERYQLLSLTERAGNATIPRFQLIDIRAQKLNEGFSSTLLQRIKYHLEQGNQVLVYLNRRGFAPVLMCHQCGHLHQCVFCDAKLTVHKYPPHLHCHHCSYSCAIPKTCIKCGNLDLRAVGQGTEKAEENLETLFGKKTPIIRIDSESMSRKDAMHNLMVKLHQGEACVLVGTQMIAKGHHFPHVTLVAIVDADGGFFSADFRAAERLSQIILQVAGRAGRADKPGEVLIQTRQPDNPLLLQLIREGYTAFANTLLRERALVGLPPFNYLALLRAESPQQQNNMRLLEDIAEFAKQHQLDCVVDIWGPVPAPMEKRAGRFRAQLLFKSAKRSALHTLLSQVIPLIETLDSSKKVRWSIDVDPYDTM